MKNVLKKTVRQNFLAALAVMAIGLMTGLTACNNNDPQDEPVPVDIKVSSCSITEGAQYRASELKEVTLSYNTAVTVSPSANITLNGTPCTATDSPSAATDVIVTLPALEDGKAYTLTVPLGAVVGRDDNTVRAFTFKVNFKTAVKPIENDATALTERLGWGWNLGNHFDTSSGKDGTPTQWGYWDNARPAQTLYTNLKAAGVSTVRICVTWGNYQKAAPWTIDAAYMAEVRQNVDWAEAAGLNVILNMHHDEYWLDIKGAANDNLVNEAVKERIAATWTQIAEAFRDKGDFLLFEAYNEVQDGGWGWGDNLNDGGKQYRTLNEWNQLVVNTIRATGGGNATRWIGVPGYASNPRYALSDSFELPADDAGRLMVSVHYYDPSNFTLFPQNDDGKSEWGHTAAAGKYAEGSNEEHVNDTFRRLQEKYVANNIPVYIGEYGCVMHTTSRSNLFRNYYLEYVCRAAHTYNLSVILWDNNSTGGGNEHHGYFNHNDGTYLNNLGPLVQTMIRAATADDLTYTLETIYASAPK